jgi:hypothetical protein
MKKWLGISAFLLLLIQGCTTTFQRSDFIGTWKSTDGAIIKLLKNGTFEVKHLNIHNFYPNEAGKDKIIGFNGTWDLIESGGTYSLQLRSKSRYSYFGINNTYREDGVVYSHRIAITLDVDKGGFASNRSSVYLFTWVGDPDDLSMYKFTKQ